VDEQEDALGLRHAVANLDGVADGLHGSIGRYIGSAEDRVLEILTDRLADNLLEEDLDCPGQRP